MKVSYPYIEAFPLNQAPEMGSSTTTVSILIDRGPVVAFQVIETVIGNPIEFFHSTTITISAGGREVLQDYPIYGLDPAYKSGITTHHLPKHIEENQQVIIEIDNVNGLADYDGYIVFIHANEYYDKLKGLQRMSLGLSRRSYRIPIPAATSVTQVLSGTVPTNQGDLIGYSIDSIDEAFQQRSTYTVNINNTETSRNVPLRFSGVGSTSLVINPIHYMPIRSGSRFNVSIVLNSAHPTPTSVYITFYFKES